MNPLYTWLGDTLGSTEVNLANASLRLVISLILGSAVGVERKNRGQVAGIRTFALICMGACMAMLLSIYVPQEYMGLKNGDPGRIAAQVVTGVGFLGGGAMIQQKGSIRGLTTAAGIWMVAILGMAIGVGMYWESIFATFLILLTLTWFEGWRKGRKLGMESKVISVKVHDVLHSIDGYKELFENNRVHLSTYYLEVDYDHESTEINFVVLIPPKYNLMQLFDKLRELTPTQAITLSNQIDI